MTLLQQLVIALVPLVVATILTAIYLNRRKSDRLYQRMFGLEDDSTDEGAMHKLDRQIQDIDQNLKDLNHRRIDDIEEQLIELQETMETLEERLEAFEEN